MAYALQNSISSAQGQRTPRQDTLPSALRATTAFVLWILRGVGLPGDRQGAMLALAVDAVATRLQDEGTTLFVNAWHERRGVIAAKSATLVQAR